MSNKIFVLFTEPIHVDVTEPICGGFLRSGVSLVSCALPADTQAAGTIKSVLGRSCVLSEYSKNASHPGLCDGNPSDGLSLRQYRQK